MSILTEEALIGAVRITHIASAIAMAGGGFLWVLIVAPTLGKRVPGPALGALMSSLGPRMGRYFSSLAYLVLASGVVLLASIFGWRNLDNVLFGGTTYGTVLLLGSVAFLVGLGLSEGILAPTGRKLSSLPPDAPMDEIARLQRRSARTFVAIACFDFAALTMMALAVNARA